MRANIRFGLLTLGTETNAMKNYIVYGLGICLLAAGCGNSKPADPAPSKDSTHTQAPTPAPAETDFAVFWTHFREAALAGDYAGLAKRTRFPLQSRGMMDEQPVVTYTEAEFEKLFGLFLKTPTGLNANNFDETQLDYIKANPTLKFSETKLPMMQGNKTAAVTSMEFENTPQGWKLTFLYLTDEVYAKTGKQAI